MERVPSAAAETNTVAAFAAHAPMLRRYLQTLGARLDRIDDLVQETFVVALQKLEDHDPWAVAAWLRGVARNLPFFGTSPCPRERTLVLSFSESLD